MRLYIVLLLAFWKSLYEAGNHIATGEPSGKHTDGKLDLVGSAVSLAKAGASVVDMQVAGRWKSAQMPAHYAKAELAERGAIARFKDGKR